MKIIGKIVKIILCGPWLPHAHYIEIKVKGEKRPRRISNFLRFEEEIKELIYNIGSLTNKEIIIKRGGKICLYNNKAPN